MRLVVIYIASASLGYWVNVVGLLYRILYTCDPFYIDRNQYFFMASANLRIRTDLMRHISDYIGMADLTQQQAAKLFGVPQPRISEIVQGKNELFTVDKLVNLLERVGQKVEINCIKNENKP